VFAWRKKELEDCEKSPLVDLHKKIRILNHSRHVFACKYRNIWIQNIIYYIIK